MKLQLKVTDKREIYSYWLKMTSFIHKLPDRKQEVLLEFLLERESLMKQTNNNEVLTRELLFADGTKKKICDRINLPIVQFRNNIMPVFRDKGIVLKTNGVYDINKKIIPDFKDNSVTFQFKIINE